MRTRRTRSGFTILEVVVVMALLIVLAAVTLPSFAGIKGNADQKAAADTVRARIADARGLAMDQGSAYRLAVHQDGTKIRLAPDTPDFATVAASDAASAYDTAIESTLEKATLAVDAATDSGDVRGADPTGWITVGTFLPNGTCREDDAIVLVKDANFPDIRIRLRGITGGSKVLLPDSSSGGMK